MRYLPFIGGAAIALGLLARPGKHVEKKTTADDSTYTLSGNVKGLDTGLVFLYHPGDGPTDSTTISHGQFNFAGRLSGPEFCHLLFRKLNGDQIYSLPFFLQSGALNLKGRKDAMSEVVFSGAPIQDEYLDFEKKAAALMARKMFAQVEQLTKDYAAAHPDSYIAIHEARNYFSYNPDADTLQRIYNGFSPLIQNSREGKLLKATLDAALVTGIGRSAPEFTQDDTKGKPVALSSFKGRYVLVDFWASWCGPCREENPNVLKNYEHYHSKGFTVLGVSLDDEKDEWLEAVRKDRLPWNQVSDLKGWKNSVAILYGVEGIPMNFLVDKDGKIVAKGLRGPDLDKKLEEFLH